MRSLSAAVLTAALAGAATAAPLFSDNFDTENGGNTALNYTGFTKWNVSGRGTVDLVKSGDFGLLGSGLFVDLDGSNGNAGLFSTKSTFGPGTYEVKFTLGGSQRGGTESVTVTLGDWSTTISNIPSSQPFNTPYTFLVTTTTTGSLSFQNAGGDNVGALLDNVVVSPVPEPVSLVVFGSLVVGGMVAVRRRMAKA